MAKSKKKANNTNPITASKDESCSNDNESLFTKIKAELQKFKSSREKISKQLEKLCNLRNTATFVAPKNIASSIGNTLDPTKFFLLFNEEFFQLTEDILCIRNEVDEAIVAYANILQISEKTTTESIPVDHSALSKLLDEMQRQHSVESLAISAACDIENDSIDQDALITLLACFKYPPYLNIYNLDIILSS